MDEVIDYIKNRIGAELGIRYINLNEFKTKFDKEISNKKTLEEFVSASEKNDFESD